MVKLQLFESLPRRLQNLITFVDKIKIEEKTLKKLKPELRNGQSRKNLELDFDKFSFFFYCFL